MNDVDGMTTLREGIRWARVCDLPGFSVDLVEVDAGSRETLIVHEECDEAWYVLEGELQAVLGEQVTTVVPGDWVRVPRGQAHGSRNESSAVVRLLVVNSPPWHPDHDHDAEPRGDPSAG